MPDYVLPAFVWPAEPGVAHGLHALASTPTRWSTASPSPTTSSTPSPDGIGIRDLQLTHEFVNPGWPAATIAKVARRIRRALDRTGVRVTSGMTGPYGRLNHFGHPDPDVRRYYVDWFKTFADVWAELGAAAVGSQFAIFTHRDYDDPAAPRAR